MVWSIVKQDDGILSPASALLIQVSEQLSDKKEEGVSIVLASIDREEKFTPVANGSYDIELAWPLCHCSFVLHTFDQPTSLTMFSDSNDALIDIDDSSIVLNILDVVRCSILPLQLRVEIVVECWDWPQLSIRNIQLLFHVPPYHCRRNIELCVFLDDCNYIRDLNGHLRIDKKFLNSLSSSLMKFAKSFLRLILLKG